MENKLSYWAAPSSYTKQNTKKEMIIINVKLIVKVCEFYDISLEDLKGDSRKGHLVEARQIIFYIFRKHFKYSFSEIGEMFNRTHATVLSGVNKISDYIEYDKDLKYRVNKFLNFSKYLIKGEDINYSINKSSIYKGVSFHKSTNRWRAVIRIEGKQKHLGTFSNDRDAHLAYEKEKDLINKTLTIKNE